VILSATANPCTFEQNQGILIDEIRGRPLEGDIFFLHGWGGSRDSLRELAGLFEGSYRIHLIDLPGFGEAPPPPRNWGTTDYAEHLAEYLTKSDGARVLLVGHSFGGRLAIRVAGRRTPTVAGLVLMGVPGLPPERFSPRSIRRAMIRGLRRVLKLLEPITGPGPMNWHTSRFGSKDYLNAGQLRTLLVRTVSEDLTDPAKAVSCPALLIWGSEDRETPPGLAQRYARLLGGKTALSVLPHKDHFPFQGTGAHLCAFRIRSWLAANVDQ
jgi:pimeloyl-ACP methyl ester carboxylesterase